MGEARAARAARGEQPRHLVNDVRIVDRNGGAVNAVSYMTLVLTKTDGTSIVDCAGTYTDRFVEVDGRWLIAARRITFDRDLVVAP